VDKRLREKKDGDDDDGRFNANVAVAPKIATAAVDPINSCERVNAVFIACSSNAAWLLYARHL